MTGRLFRLCWTSMTSLCIEFATDWKQVDPRGRKFVSLVWRSAFEWWTPWERSAAETRPRLSRPCGDVRQSLHGRQSNVKCGICLERPGNVRWKPRNPQLIGLQADLSRQSINCRGHEMVDSDVEQTESKHQGCVPFPLKEQDAVTIQKASTYGTHWSGGSALDLYSGGTRFESLSRQRLPWLQISVISSGPPGKFWD